MKPTFFKIDSSKFYLKSVMDIISTDTESTFFEFYIDNSDKYSPDRVLVSTNSPSKGEKKRWKWFILVKDNFDGKKLISYHYYSSISSEKDFFTFAKFVLIETPDAISYILFNYLV
jgi:hypothetical protein